MKQSLFPLNPVLIIDDEIGTLRGFSLTLKSAGITNLMLCDDPETVDQLISDQQIEVVLLDLIMPKVSGEKLLTLFSDDYPEIPVIVITGNSLVDMAVNCMKKGAFDYMVKPVENNRLVSGVKRAIEFRGLQNENRRLKEQIFSEEIKNPDVFSQIVTRNKRMTSLFKYTESIAKSLQPVLITGETGVGKELMAQAIHQLSGRTGHMVTANVAGIDSSTFSDTLFGHVKGAFTGADSKRSGLVEKAFSGTLFLDEIGDLNPDNQVKLLRLLQEREFFPLGADLPKIADVKIIVATNCNLESLLETGRFRKDLYYRLCSHQIEIPPLRERPDDLPLLVSHFISLAAKEMGKPEPSVPSELYTLMENHLFPGNIRELKSIIYDTIARSNGKQLSLDPFEKHLHTDHPGSGILKISIEESGNNMFRDLQILPTIEEATHLLIDEAMNRTGNNQSMAARFLQISRQRLGRYLKKSQSAVNQ